MASSRLALEVLFSLKVQFWSRITNPRQPLGVCFAAALQTCLERKYLSFFPNKPFEYKNVWKNRSCECSAELPEERISRWIDKNQALAPGQSLEFPREGSRETLQGMKDQCWPSMKLPKSSHKHLVLYRLIPSKERLFLIYRLENISGLFRATGQKSRNRNKGQDLTAVEPFV